MNTISAALHRLAAASLAVWLAFPAQAAGQQPVPQPKWGKQTAKSVFTLKTFDANGTLLASATGFYVGSRGEAVSCYEPFRGAWRAVVIDADGKEWPVDRLLGASETYDAARFRVAVKKSEPLPTDTTSRQALLWLQPYMEKKRLQPLHVSRIENIQQQSQYLTLTPACRGDQAGAPLLDQHGCAVAMLQAGSTEGDTLCYALGAAFAARLQMSGLSLNDPAMKATHVRKALPPTADQALLTLYVAAAQMDSTDYAALVEDFVADFPGEPEGYMTRARALMAGRQWDKAEEQLLMAEKAVADKPDQADFTRHNCQQLRANMLMEQQQWQQAADILHRLADTPLRSAEIYLQAANCHAQMKDTLGQLAMLDSAMSIQPKPLLREAAPILLARAQARMGAGKWRLAVSDLNEYETLMAQQVNANFYYTRYQAEVEGHLYQQALDDIKRAADMQPQESLYPAEQAWLQLRVGLWDEAISSAQRCLQIAPDNSDAHLFMGIALCQKGQKKEGLQQLSKARELGNDQADELIKKYSE